MYVTFNTEKILEEIFSCDDEDNSEDHAQLKNKRTKATKIKSPVKRIKIEKETACDAETIESLELEEQLHDSQDGSIWNDQCVPGGKTRDSALEWEESAIATEDPPEDPPEDSQFDADTYTDDYNSADYTVTETTQDAASPSTQYEYQTVVLQDEFGNVINCDDDQQIVFLQQGESHSPPDGETIGYFDGEKIIYVDQNQDDASSKAQDVAVQTSSQKPRHSYVPIFDVYMKNGNVTGFVVDETGAMGVHASENTQSEPAVVEHDNVIPDVPAPNGTQEIHHGDTYTKHEYIHRYNIDRYMTLANFPKYIDTLAKKTRNDALSMLTRVYNEKAMFKMTTTQKGKEGNTKIWYLTDVRRKGKYKMSEEEKMKRDKIGQYLTDILILKEKVKTLTSDNGELVSRNKYLEDVALRLAKLRQ